jgi:ketosteroid isomerase-like protein
VRVNTLTIAKRLVELCREGKYEEAQNELYADDAVSIEMEGLPAGALGNAKGLPAIREKGRRWQESVEAVHGGEVSDPLIAGSWFSVSMRVDVTYKGVGRVDMREIGLYRVRDGKIVHEQFFYDMG